MSQQEQQDKSQYFYRASAADFMKIPGGPLAYWVTDSIRKVFENSKSLADYAAIKQGLATCNNNLFLRNWYEVNFSKVSFSQTSRETAKNSGYKWFPYNKGGGYRHWYGNQEAVVNWENDGKAIHEYNNLPIDYSGAPVRAKNYYFREGVTYSLISSYGFSARRVFKGSIFDVGGSMVFPTISPNLIQGLMSSKLSEIAVSILNPTLNYQVGDIAKIPVDIDALRSVSEVPIEKCIQISKKDWDIYECSHEFSQHPLLQYSASLESAYLEYVITSKEAVNAIKNYWAEVNLSILDAYGLSSIDPHVDLKDITLNANPVYRYGSMDDDTELRFKSDTTVELVSYIAGCMMGRYSIDKPGLILASQGETLQDYLNQIPNPRFMPDSDAILPLTDQEWFADDVTNRVREFVKVMWGEETLQENLAFIADSLCLHAIKPKKGEGALDTIRRYLSTQFYKDHLKTYKKRPIYWLFSSGKEKAFECLVYLHRYNESTLARMRTEYVTPLMGKYDAQHSLLLEQKNDASPAQQRELEKDLKTLEKKQTELRAFDEQLKHYADMRIKLDLDDGVKVNYGKFGNLLAEVKAVTGDKG